MERTKPDVSRGRPVIQTAPAFDPRVRMRAFTDLNANPNATAMSLVHVDLIQHYGPDLASFGIRLLNHNFCIKKDDPEHDGVLRLADINDDIGMLPDIDMPRWAVSRDTTAEVEFFTRMSKADGSPRRVSKSELQGLYDAYKPILERNGIDIRELSGSEYEQAREVLISSGTGISYPSEPIDFAKEIADRSVVQDRLGIYVAPPAMPAPIPPGRRPSGGVIGQRSNHEDIKLRVTSFADMAAQKGHTADFGGSGKLDVDKIYNRQFEALKGLETCYSRHMKSLAQVAEISPESISEWLDVQDAYLSELKSWEESGRQGEMPVMGQDPINPVGAVLQAYADDVRWYYTGADRTVYLMGESSIQPGVRSDAAHGIAVNGQAAYSGAKNITDHILAEAGGGSFHRSGDRIVIDGDPVAKLDREGADLTAPVTVYAAAASQFEPAVDIVRDPAYPGGARIEKFSGNWTRQSDKPVEAETSWVCDRIPGHYFETSLVLAGSDENLSADYIGVKTAPSKAPLKGGFTDKVRALFARLKTQDGADSPGQDGPGGPGESW